MGKITDLNVTARDPGKLAALLGDAHELIVAGLLIRLGFEAGMMSAKGEPYDLWIMAYEKPKGKRKPLRAQVRTISKGGSIKLIGGVRGGKNRYYRSGVKEYKYTTEHSDLIIGVDVKTLDLYLVPTKFTEHWGKSKAVSTLEPLKNNWDMLLNWNNEYLEKLGSQMG